MILELCLWSEETCLLQFIEEAERSLHDAIMIVRRALKNSNVVAGGGAIDVSKIVTCLCLARAPLVLEILGVLCYWLARTWVTETSSWEWRTDTSFWHIFWLYRWNLVDICVNMPALLLANHSSLSTRTLRLLRYFGLQFEHFIFLRSMFLGQDSLQSILAKFLTQMVGWLSLSQIFALFYRSFLDSCVIMLDLMQLMCWTSWGKSMHWLQVPFGNEIHTKCLFAQICVRVIHVVYIV
jgi:hypothetical protein